MKKNRKSPSDINFEDYCVEMRCVEKSIRVGVDLIEDLFNKSEQLKKKPMLVIGIKKNDKEQYVLHCNITLERHRSNK